ncbi:MAG: AAA family ATPase [Dehalococcoidales bacterium]|nr:AAA family ATPase [Dehalococcoidales bacterium]
MTFSIAVAGKGGSGKTSITSLIIRYLKNIKKGPILAVDADSNANLGESLGFDIKQTIGSIIASFNNEKINIPQGMTKEAYLEYKLNEAIIESKGLDLLVMGRGEGADCYCYPNSVLRKFIDSLAGNYAYMVMDNEAGMEHLSRRTTRDVDALLIISNHSVKGVRTVARIRDLVAELGLAVKRQLVIINFAPSELHPTIKEELERLKIGPVVLVPEDELIYKYDLELKPLLDLPDTSKSVEVVGNLMAEILPLKQVTK